MTIIRKIKVTSIGTDIEKRESLYTVGDNMNYYSHCNHIIQQPQKLYAKKEYIQKIELNMSKGICTPMYNIQHYSQYPTNGINLRVHHKINRTFATTWMNMEDIMLSESQAQKEKCYMISHAESKKVEFTDIERRLTVTRGYRGGRDGELFKV